GDERSGAEGREHAAVVVNAGGEVRASTNRRPGLDVGSAQGEDAGRAGGAAGLIYALDLRRRHAQVAPERGRLVHRLLELGFGAEWKPSDVLQRKTAIRDAGLAEPARIKGRAVHQVAELLLPRCGPANEGVLGRLGLDVAIPGGIAVAGVARQASGSCRRH